MTQSYDVAMYATPCCRHHRFAGAWLAILCCSALTLADASSPISPSQRVPAECQLHISGAQDGHITAASMQCTSHAQPDFALDQVLLRGFQATGFQHVDATSSCQAKATCLVTMCSGLLVLRNSSISGVRSGSLKSLICVLGSSRLEVHNSQFVQNTARPFASFGQVQLVLRGSNISHNMVDGSGGGLWAEGSSVLITDSSHVSNNSARGLGGGLFAQSNASVTLTGSSSVHHNVAQKDSGGGVAALDSSIVVTAYGSVHGNVAQHETGGGIAALGNSSVVVDNGSSVHSNAARRNAAGGVGLWHSATLTLAGGSSVHNNTALWLAGGVFALDNASVTLSGGSSVHHNVAQESGGGGCMLCTVPNCC